jgi:hypothetical protein
VIFIAIFIAKLQFMGPSQHMLIAP